MASKFVSEDPVGFRAGQNEYAYASQNPMSFNDPLGLLDFDVGDHLSCHWGWSSLPTCTPHIPVPLTAGLCTITSDPSGHAILHCACPLIKPSVTWDASQSLINDINSLGDTIQQNQSNKILATPQKINDMDNAN
jgi:hypothetical protein